MKHCKLRYVCCSLNICEFLALLIHGSRELENKLLLSKMKIHVHVSELRAMQKFPTLP